MILYQVAIFFPLKLPFLVEPTDSLFAARGDKGLPVQSEDMIPPGKTSDWRLPLASVLT
jgi:hypothetical protein